MGRIITSFLLMFVSLASFAQDYSWKAIAMDGSRTGCTAPSVDDVPDALGTFHKGKYVSPGGRTYKRNSIVAKTARIVLDAQPDMARVKEVIAYSPKAMEVVYPEGPLSNWFIDLLMEKVGDLVGEKVDIGISNFGGIRVDMPEGDVILDDMLSMFPFRNQLVYVRQKGSEIRKILDRMASDGFQVLGGLRVVAEDGKIVSASVGNEPIDDDKVYGVATITFLLHGGDGLSLADNALSVEVFDVDIIDAVLEHVKSETEAGRPIVSESDGRVVIR